LGATTGLPSKIGPVDIPPPVKKWDRIAFGCAGVVTLLFASGLSHGRSSQTGWLFDYDPGDLNYYGAQSSLELS
jgi:hypothetical protein